MNNSSLEAGIPVLTEVIEGPKASSEPQLRESASAQPAITNDFASPAPQALTLEARASQLDDEAWDRMEREIRERILQQVLERIDFVLEQRVRDSLADALQTAVDRLANDIKGGLHNSIRELVTRSVTQEIARLQIPKK